MRGVTTRSISIAAVENGENAVSYNFVFSGESYARVVDGRLSCHLLCQVWRVEGDSRESFEDIDPTMPHDRDWTVVVEVGTKSSSSIGTLEIDHDSVDYSLTDEDYAEVGRPTMLNVGLRADSRWYAQAQFPVTVNGADGQDVVRCDFEDEQWMVPCDSDGKVTGSFPAWSTTGHLFLGTEELPLDDSKCAVVQGRENALTCTLVVNGKKATVAVTGFGANSSEVNTLTVTLADGAGHEASQVLKVVKTTLPTVYQLRPASSVIKADNDGGREPADFLSVGAVRISGGVVSDVDFTGRTAGTTVPVKAQWRKNGTGSWTDCGEKQSGQGQIQRYTYGVNLDGTETEVALRLVSNDANLFVYDEETIPLVSDGKKGDDAVGYEIVLDEDSVAEIDADDITTAVVSGYLYKVEGGNRTSFVPTGGIKLQMYDLEEEDNWDDMQVDGNGHFFNDGWTAMQDSDYVHKDALRLRLIDGSGTLLATAQLPFNKVGPAGPRGYDGLIIRTTEWEQGKEYRNDTNTTNTEDGRRYLDIVTLSSFDDAQSADFMSAASYVCKSTHTSTERSPKKPDPNSQYWEIISETGPIKTPLIWAARALLSFLQVHQVTITNLEGDVIGAIGSDSQFPIKFGTNITDPTKINFSVSAAGKMYCVGADIHGNVTIQGDDGLVVLDSDGNERVRISSDTVGTPPTDTHYNLSANGNHYDGGDEPGDLTISTQLSDGANTYFTLQEGQKLEGALTLVTLSKANVVASILSTGTVPEMEVTVSLYKSDKGLVKSCTFSKALAKGDEFSQYVLCEDIGQTAVGRFVARESGSDYYITVMVELTGLTNKNFNCYGSVGLYVFSFSLALDTVSEKKTTIAPDGMCVNMGTNRHILMNGSGILLRWGGVGLRLADDGLSRLTGNGMASAFGQSREVTASTLLTSDDKWVWVAINNTLTLTLPSTSYEGHEIVVRKTVSGSSVYTIKGAVVESNQTSISNERNINDHKTRRYTYHGGKWYEEISQ